MKKLIILIAAVACTAALVYAQNADLTAPDQTIVGADSANFALREVSIDLFEKLNFSAAVSIRFLLLPRSL